MKTIGILLVSILLTLATIAQSKPSYAAIEAKAVDYLMAWYQGDTELMRRTIDPNMSKKIVFDTGHSHGAVAYLSAEDLLTQTKKKRVESRDSNDLKKDITILDIYRNTATVKAETANWIDYLHMARIQGEWRIVNILWELKSEDL